MGKKLELLIKKALQKRGEILHNRMCKIRTEVLLKNIESEKGKINPKFKKLSLEYAQDVLGSKIYAPWLVVYSAITEDFIEGWIPENYFESEIVPCFQGLYGRLSFANSISKKLLNTNCIPDIAYHVNGLFFSPAWEVLQPNVVEKYLFEFTNKVVYKQDNSNRGRGVYVFTKETFDIEKILKIGNGVFQRFIIQHRFFEDIMPDIVATLRLTSIVEDTGKTSCRAAFIRIGRKDETHCKWASDIKIPVDLLTGKLNDKGYEAVNFRSTFFHPDSKVAFKGKTIPKFEDCIKFVERMHQEIPFCRMVGWDLIVNENDEIELMEWNGFFNDIVFSEATQGPCFADMGWEKLWKRRITKK